MPGIEEGASTSTNASRPRRSCLALADSIRESVDAFVSKLKPDDPPTIYKVRQTIREVKEVAYEPKMVSIGPYHHGKERLQGMEENKLFYLDSFLARNPDHPLEEYLEATEELKDKARSCYCEKVDPLVDNEFVKMMVLDACFIVEIFLRFHPGDRKKKLLRQKRKELEQKREELEQKREDLELVYIIKNFLRLPNDFEAPTLRTFGVATLIGYDMLLLENQIPFFLLQKIFKIACPVDVPHALEKMALDFFDEFMPRNKKIKIQDSYYHLLHLFHWHLSTTPTNSEDEPDHSCIPKIKLKPNLSCISCIPKIKPVLNKLKNLLPCSNKAPLPITKWRQMIPCATDLQLAGVKFKKNEKSNNILNVKFSPGVLEITPFAIHYHSDTLFRNLIAFEQCCPEADGEYFTTYISFMDYLVNTSKDVALLHQNGIIDNYLGSDEDVALLFNRLRIGIVHNFNGSYLSDVKDNVQKHCENKWNMWRASLKRDYFTNPWSFISLIAASILLLLTITQTFFTIFPYFRPRS